MQSRDTQTSVQRIQIRRDTAASWQQTNPVLASGEPAFESDTGRFKIGDGVSPWRSLPYKGDAGAVGPAGPAGPVGPIGPANTLTIGKVTVGDTPSATITGTAPNQVLDIVLPKYSDPSVVLSFTSNPSNVTAKLDETFTMTAVAQSNESPITYQWQYSNTPNDEASWIDIPGQTTTTLSLKATLARDNRWYRNTAETQSKTAKSSAAQLDVTVDPPPPPPPVKTEPVWKDAVIAGTTKRVTGYLFACRPSNPYYEKSGRPDSAGIRRPNPYSPLFTATHLSSDGINWVPFAGKTPESRGFSPPVNEVFWLNDTYMMWAAYPSVFAGAPGNAYFGWPRTTGLFVSSDGRTWVDASNIWGVPLPGAKPDDTGPDTQLDIDISASYQTYINRYSKWNLAPTKVSLPQFSQEALWGGRANKSDYAISRVNRNSSAWSPNLFWDQPENGVTTTVYSGSATPLILTDPTFLCDYSSGIVGGEVRTVGTDFKNFYVFKNAVGNAQQTFVSLEKKIERPLLPMNPPVWSNLNFPNPGNQYWVGTSSLNDGKYYINDDLDNASGWKEMTMPGADGLYMGQPVDATFPLKGSKTVIPLYSDRSWNGNTIQCPACVGIKYCE